MGIEGGQWERFQPSCLDPVTPEKQILAESTVSRPTKSPATSTFTGHREIRPDSGIWRAQCTIHSVVRSLPSCPPSRRRQWGLKMVREMAFVTAEDTTTEKLLWRVVIARTIQDWLSAPRRTKCEAEGYLFKNSADLSLVCSLAGINVAYMRTRLNKVRGRTLLDLVPAAE
jgi:hypothetical protein